MKLTLKDIKGQNLGDLDVAFPVIENGRGSQAVHDAVVAFQANKRMGTACTKTMGEVHGTGKKPWRQKGTGRARAGSFQSPLWRGGGVVFGPKPRDFGKKLNKNTRRLALQKALSERLRGGDVVVVDDLKLGTAKTRELVAVLQALQIDGSALVVTVAADRNLLLASRNVPGVEVISSDMLSPYEALRFDKLVFTRSALEQVGQRLTR